MVGFEAKVLLDGVCVAYVTTLFYSHPHIVEWLTDGCRGTSLSQDPPWPQMIGEQIRSMPAVHYTNTGGYRYVLSYAYLTVIEEDLC